MDRGPGIVTGLVLSRVAAGGATLLLVITLGFVLLQLMPGDAAQIVEDPSLSLEDRERLRAALGLDKPPAEQFLAFATHALRGDLGISLSYQRPVRAVLWSAFWPTILLTGSALCIAFAIGLGFGTLAATREGGFADRVVRRVLPVLDAMPPFWLGLLAIYFFSARLGWLPASHMTSVGAGGGGLVDRLAHLLLPALVLGIPSAAPVARHHAQAMRRELASAYTRAAHAMGLGRARVLARAGRNALHPTLTLLGLALPAMVGGAVVVEVVFSWPGLGQVHQRALLARDVPLALGGLLLIGGMVITGGLASDLLSALLDPRWRRRT